MKSDIIVEFNLKRRVEEDQYRPTLNSTDYF